MTSLRTINEHKWNVLVDGVPLETAARYPVSDPSTGRPLTHVPDYSEADVDRAVEAARQAQKEWGIGLLIVAAFGTGFGFFGYFALLFAIGLSLPAGAAAMQSITTLAYPEQFRATGMGSAGFAGRLGTLTYGALGGTLVGAGFGLTTISLVLAVPLAVSIGLVFGLRALSRRAGIAAEPQQIPPEGADAVVST